VEKDRLDETDPIAPVTTGRESREATTPGGERKNCVALSARKFTARREFSGKLM